VLDDGTGRGVGYILGTVDTRAFAGQWTEQFIPVLEDQGIPKPDSDTNTNWHENLPGALGLLAYSPDQVLHDNFPELLGQYPSHLHIDILPSHQGRGGGRVLMQTFLEALRKQGSRGAHLGMNASNDGAMKFYRRMGFQRFAQVMDKGKSGEIGRDGTTVYMVASL
jgi:ribosomal protein S18 acetylase RimI-like enzyme